jgi:peroxiredoxin
MKTALIIISVLFMTPMIDREEITGYNIGDYATDFKLKNVDGEMVSLSDFPEAKGYIISFTCNSCPYSVLYEQRIIDLDNKYASKGYPVIAINPNDPAKDSDDSFEKMVERASQKNYPFPYLVDETQATTRAYGATNTPHMYVLQKDNDKHKVMYIGTIDNNPKNPGKVTKFYIDDAMSELLSGQEVKVSKTKAVGCGIKWKSSS